MPSHPLYYQQLSCPACGHCEVCGRAAMHARLQQAGMLRREKEPDQELLLELFQAAASGFQCSQCGHTGLAVGPVEDDDQFDEWTGGRACAGCGQLIPAERLQLFPDSRLCAACQQKEDQAPAGGDDVEYCPRCGTPLQITRSGGSGITRYVLRCPSCRGAF